MSRPELIEKYVRNKLNAAKRKNSILITVTSGIVDVVHSMKNVDIEIIDLDDVSDSELASMGSDKPEERMRVRSSLAPIQASDEYDSENTN